MTGMAPLVGATHGELLSLAADGDQEAWNALVERFGQMVWAIARSFRLDDATAKDVSQTVWLKLVENCGRIQDPERLPGWLATTCRREAIRASRSRERLLPTAHDLDVADESADLDSMLIEDEEARSVVRAFKLLSDDCRRLLRLLAVDPPLSYDEIAALLDRPVGSLGPTRARCLDRLKSSIGDGIKRPDHGSFETGERR